MRPIAEIAPIKRLVVTAGELGRWDTLLMTFRIGVIDRCRERGIEVDSSALPAGAQGFSRLVDAVCEQPIINR